MTPTTPTGERAAIYIRISDRKQEDNYSLETQEERARAYCAGHGYAVVGVYREVHTGRDLFDRPELSALRMAIRRREVDVVVAHALDRLTRQQAHLGLLVSEMDYAGVRLELVTEVFENTPEGKLIQGVKAYAAEIERLKIAERTQRGTRARAEHGALIAGCRASYGYRWIDDTDAIGEVVRPKARLAIDPVTSDIVIRIYRDVLAGISTRAISLALTAEGIPTPTGKRVWGASTVNCILTNPV
jgi:site-specific DNA recombinase